MILKNTTSKNIQLSKLKQNNTFLKQNQTFEHSITVQYAIVRVFERRPNVHSTHTAYSTEIVQSTEIEVQSRLGLIQ